ncbi:MAG: hypothetical protein J6F31_10180 [Oscillospiraceae bacterium]|nr:hypothetical protein [Oscillospiraceae bacterium]
MLIIDLLIAVAVTAWIVFFVIKGSEKKDRMFLEAVFSNSENLKSGGSFEYKGRSYSLGTELKRYRMCISYIVMTEVRGTDLVHEDDFGKMSVMTVLVTLFGGWWGFPWGPIRTIETLAKHEGETMTVGQLLFRMENNVG